jgi:hypothetical protein
MKKNHNGNYFYIVNWAAIASLHCLTLCTIGTLQIVREVQVFPKLPARTTTKGYKAQDWDPNTIWKGPMRVLQVTYPSPKAAQVGLGAVWKQMHPQSSIESQKISVCIIRLQDSKSGELFGECIIKDAKDAQLAVESVTDSSRYFVLRLTDRQSGRSAFCGLGFNERSEAFDFNVALQEFGKLIRYESGVVDDLASHAPLDLSLQSGEKIEINIEKVCFTGGLSIHIPPNHGFSLGNGTNTNIFEFWIPVSEKIRGNFQPRFYQFDQISRPICIPSTTR